MKDLKLIQLYCTVCRYYDSTLAAEAQRLSNNFRPEFTDEECITVYLLGIAEGKFEVMRYPKLLRPGDTIGVCAPSSGVSEDLWPRLDRAFENVKTLGYRTVETPSVRTRVKCVSGDAQTRVAEFMRLYENPEVAAIIPPWGGQFLMELLPLLDFALLSELPPKWVCGYSDISTLTFALTINCDMATVHGSNFMNMGFTNRIHASDLAAFEVISGRMAAQRSSEYWANWDCSNFDQKTEWKALRGGKSLRFSGRMIGGCMETLGRLAGTKYAPVPAFLERYKADGFVWTLESSEMSAAEISRTLWQMRECGWFQYCNGVLYGRPAGYSDTRDFTLTDALDGGFGSLGVPVVYDADIGHVPPQIQIVNGAYGTVEFADGGAVITQEMRA